MYSKYMNLGVFSLKKKIKCKIEKGLTSKKLFFSMDSKLLNCKKKIKH